MRIFITTMEDPIYTNEFIKKIIDKNCNEIIGLAVSKPGRFRTKKAYFDISYLITLLIIAGFRESLKQIINIVKFDIKKCLSRKIKWVKSPSIIQFAQERGIPTWRVKSVNDRHFLQILKELKPDIIINQAQEILKKDFLSIPRIGVINRHNSLLPKHRGRMAPFWALYCGEKKTGVTIHFVTEKIDAGEIIVQKEVKIEPNDTFVTLTRKCYEVAPKAMIEAIEKLRSGKNLEGKKILKKKGTYHSIPTIKDALKYRRILENKRKHVKSMVDSHT